MINNSVLDFLASGDRLNRTVDLLGVGMGVSMADLITYMNQGGCSFRRKCCCQQIMGNLYNCNEGITPWNDFEITLSKGWGYSIM